MERLHTCELDLLWACVVCEVQCHERHEATPWRQRLHYLPPVLHGPRRCGYRRLQVGHDDGPPKIPRAATQPQKHYVEHPACTAKNQAAATIGRTCVALQPRGHRLPEDGGASRRGE